MLTVSPALMTSLLQHQPLSCTAEPSSPRHFTTFPLSSLTASTSVECGLISTISATVPDTVVSLSSYRPESPWCAISTPVDMTRRPAPDNKPFAHLLVIKSPSLFSMLETASSRSPQVVVFLCCLFSISLAAGRRVWLRSFGTNLTHYQA